MVCDKHEGWMKHGTPMILEISAWRYRNWEILHPNAGYHATMLHDFWANWTLVSLLVKKLCGLPQSGDLHCPQMSRFLQAQLPLTSEPFGSAGRARVAPPVAAFSKVYASVKPGCRSSSHAPSCLPILAGKIPNVFLPMSRTLHAQKRNPRSKCG